MQEFGAKLHTARKAKGLTQQDMANKLKIHRTTYTKYETNVAEPSLALLRELAVLLEISVDELLSLK